MVSDEQPIAAEPRSPLPLKEWGSDRLIVGMLGTMDMGNIAATLGDVYVAGLRKDEWKGIVLNSLNNRLADPAAFAKLSDAQLYSAAAAQLRYLTGWQYEQMYAMAKTAAASGSGAKITQLGISTELDLLGYDMWWDIMFGMPQRLGVYRKMQRFWNRNLSAATPNPQQTFLMWRHGLKTEYDVITSIEEDYGFNATDAKAYLQTMFTDPSIMTLSRLGDYATLDPTWITKKLKLIGLRDEDISMYYNMLSTRKLKDELASAWSRISSDYAWGLYTDVQIAAMLRDWGLTQEEIDLRIATITDARERNELTLYRDAEIYLFRMDVFGTGEAAADELNSRLLNFNITATTVNAIVRLEAAKKGFEWTPD